MYKFIILINDLIKELTPSDEFQHKVDVAISFKDPAVFHNVRVVKSLQDLNLLLQLLPNP